MQRMIDGDTVIPRLALGVPVGYYQATVSSHKSFGIISEMIISKVEDRAVYPLDILNDLPMFVPLCHVNVVCAFSVEIKRKHPS